MKIKRGNLLTAILAMLCAAAVALGVGFALPKNGTKTARAAASTELIDSSGTKYDSDALDALAQAAHYDDINAMLDALDGGATLNSASFGNYSVKFGGMDWWPVYASGSQLTLWIKDSIGSITFSDGTISPRAVSPTSNNYYYSWIRAAINAGHTDLGYYYGSWNNYNAPTQYNNSVKSSSASVAPANYTVMADFATGGQYASFIVSGGGYSDNVWLPTMSEVQGGGVWGCTITQWNATDSTKGNAFWLRSPVTSVNERAPYIGSEGSTGQGTCNIAGGSYGARPAINIDLSNARRATVGDVEATYTGSTLSIADVAADKKKWYDASLMDLTYPTANATDMVDVDTYTVKAELNATAIAAGYIFRGDADSTKGDGDESDTIRYFNFKINPKPLPVPTITNSPQTYDPTNGSSFTVSSTFDAATMKAETVSATGITWNAASNCFDATNVGTYSVKFVLKDKVNYVWNVGANGTTADQPTTVKVNPKPLTIPTITAPQAYTGSALQFVLADFNSGADIKVDGVTAANGSTVTGAGGSSITDTTDTFEAIKVDKYTVKLSLRDPANYAWSDGVNTSKNVQFEITQKELLSTPPVSSSVNQTGGAEWKFGDSSTITITDNRITGENINLLCYYDVAGGTSKSNTLTGTFDGTTNTTTITMPNNIAVGKYTLTVELNGSTGDNANYKITINNTLNFEVTSGKIDPSTYGWIYTKDGAAGGTIADGDKLPFALKAGSATDGVKYELSIQIPSTDTFVIVDTSKYTSGYQSRSGSNVNTYKTIVALKSTDVTFKFEVNGTMQDTCEVELNWEIEKGKFDLTNVKWEYSLNGTSGWTEYNPANPPQYNDGYDITVRVKASTLPMGLTLDSLYTGVKESDVNNHTATISVSDFVYNSANFNAPNTSSLTLNWQIAKKNLFKGFKNVAEPFTNSDYSGNIILKQLDLGQPYAGYIDYVYYDLDNGGTIVTLQDIKDAVDLTNPHNYKVEVNIKPAYAANYTVDDSGAIPTDQFKTGSNNKLADAAIDNATAVYDGNTHFDVSHVTVTGSDSMNVTDFTVKYYKGTTPVASNALAAGELPKDAGDYCIEVILGTMAESKYILVTDRLIVKIEALGIEVPTLGTITFNGNEQKFEDYLSGASWTTYGPAGMNIIKVDGKISDRNVGSGNYTTTLELTDSNYKWIDPSTASTTKAVVKYALAADEVKPTVNGDCTVATYDWNIKPIIVDTTNMWNKGSKGATLNLPQNIKDLIAGGTLEVGYRYYDSDGVFVETPEMKSGRTFKVEAVFTGDDSARNVQFKRSETDFGAVSKSIDYTVPTSGAAAFIGNVKAFMSKTWFGLPIWAWLLITLALIILLIIIIVVAKKRAKTKEEREAKKAAKEEEKQRREEERRMQQERLEAERELARAKQEAELEKIRAQAQAAAGAGMATMAMQQQPAQQAMPTQMPVQQQQQMPQYQQQYMPVPQQQYASGYPMMAGMTDVNAIAEAKAAQAIAEAKAAEAQAKAAEAIAEAKAAQAVAGLAPWQPHGMNYGTPGQMQQQGLPYMQNQQPIVIVVDSEGQVKTVQQLNPPQQQMYQPILIANVDSAKPAQKPVEIPQITEESKNSVSANYPPDAVITTTTTVDTTKKNFESKSARGEQITDSRMFDIDGFYDDFEIK